MLVSFIFISAISKPYQKYTSLGYSYSLRIKLIKRKIKELNEKYIFIDMDNSPSLNEFIL